MEKLRWLCGAVLVLGLAVVTWADDLALLRISNQEQVATATRLLDHAYARSGNRYLVALSIDQRNALTQVGMTFETVMPSVSIRSACIVMPSNRGKAASVDVAAMGEGVALENGVYLMDRASSAAAAARDRGEVFVLPLADREVYFHYQAPTVTHLMSPNDQFPTDSVINRINKDTIIAMNQRLEAFRTRYIYADSNRAAREWIMSKFAAWGYTDITTPSFTYGSAVCSNVKVVKLGYAEPDQIVVIGGHYDSWNSQSDPMVFAPGSDDDGSGTVLTMEVARVLAHTPMRKTVVFMPFTAEEEGLIGSDYAARAFRANGDKVEAMLNYDMIGYTTDDYWDLSLSSGANTAYASLCTQVAQRATVLIPKIVTMGTSSDHYSFFEQGFDIVDNIESDFNTPGWHTNIDLTSRMNFDYMTQVVKLAAASVAQIANSGMPAVISNIVDVGDGNGLDVTVSNCGSNYQYWLYWGTSSGAYTDSVQIPAGQCTHRVTGLTTGVRYYFGVFGKPSDGYRAVWTTEKSEMPLVIPRAPQNLAIDPAEHKINLDWQDNTEADFSFYRVYRHLEGDPLYSLQADNLTTSTYVDNAVAAGLKYFYKVTAVDLTGNESALSNEVSTWPATFDGGLLVVDEMTQDYEYMASEAHQAAFFDTILSFSGHGLTRVDDLGVSFDKGVAGRYSSIVWIDDDFFNKQLGPNSGVVNWYLSHTVNMFIAGDKTIQTWSQTPVASTHTLYKEFMVSGWYADNYEAFLGGVGANGWPSVTWGGASRGLRYGYDIPVLTVRPGGTVIMTYNAADDDPNFEGKPCGVAYSGPNGKRVIVSFPLYYLTPASATALMTKVKEFFGETTTKIPPGDINHSGLTDLADLSTLVAYLTGAVGIITDKNAADVNHTCFVDLADLSTMVSYLSMAQPALQQGCVTP